MTTGWSATPVTRARAAVGPSLVRDYVRLLDILDTQENAPDAVYNQTLDAIDRATDAISEFAGTPNWHIETNSSGSRLVLDEEV